MNEHEAQRIASAMHQLRPDWPAASILTLIRKNLLDRPRRDVTVAFAWVACEANSHTPARVLEAGPWWRAAGIEGAVARPEKIDRGERCSVCSLSEPACRIRWGADHEFESAAAAAKRRTASTEDVAARVADLKAQLEPTSGPTAPMTTEDFAAKNPKLHARIQALKEANPGLREEDQP